MDNRFDSQVNRCLKEMGLSNLLPMQSEAMFSIQSGKDTLVILPPGSGKSLIFQIPAMLRLPKMTVVISPLIALMDDQVRKINGLRGVQLHSNLGADQRKAILKMVEKGEIDILYISPEGLSASTILSYVKAREVGLLVIDEVHCVSLWGHNFRPSYLFIDEIRKQLGQPQLALFTATAPPHVIEDVKRILKITELEVIMGEPFRDNISFEVVHVSSIEDKILRLDDAIRSAETGSIMIYTSTTRQAYVLYKALSQRYATSIYHGKMDPRERSEQSRLFLEGENRVMVCTSAFGMGIDKPDVYTIIHYSIPGSLEAYIQESGRAGRDSRPAKAILFNWVKDYTTQQFFVFQESPSLEKIQKVYDFLYRLNAKITEYQRSPASYAQLNHFLEKLIAEKPSLKTVASAAVGILVDFGHIVRQDEQVLFPFGEKISIDQEELEARKIIKLKRLQLMIDCANADNHADVIRRYFKTNVFNEITLSKGMSDLKLEIILGFIMKYPVSTNELLAVLEGNEEVADKKKYGDYFGAYADVWPIYIRQLLEDLTEKGCLYAAEIGNSRVHFLSEVGEAYLVQKGFEMPERNEEDFDIHHHSWRQRMIACLKEWQSQKGATDNELALFPIKHHALFVKDKLRAGNCSMTGEELLRRYNMSKTGTVAAFKGLISFFLNIQEKKVEKRKPSGNSKWRQLR
ncbi:ATP-dependent DNA helicase RecQ [Candidatus Falkowbacteria bacterium]|nr:ATP-dependent DNA helicase RecQ [Candidatus Falkowbacteria bacterium]